MTFQCVICNFTQKGFSAYCQLLGTGTISNKQCAPPISNIACFLHKLLFSLTNWSFCFFPPKIKKKNLQSTGLCTFLPHAEDSIRKQQSFWQIRMAQKEQFWHFKLIIGKIYSLWYIMLKTHFIATFKYGSYLDQRD